MKVRINLYKKSGPLDFTGWYLGVQQRGGIVHVAFEIDLEDGSEPLVWTTGARWRWLKGPVFGAVPARKYNRGRRYYQAEFTEPLTDAEAQVLLDYCKGLDGQRYGLGKVLKLIHAGRTSGDFICQIGDLDTDIRNPYCAESVVGGCWKVGRYVCRQLCRREPEVCPPTDLWIEAQYGLIIRIVNQVGIPKTV
jgi:hypothetical protein